MKVTRKGGKAARVPLAPPVVRALDAYLTDGPEQRTSGPIFLATATKAATGSSSGEGRYPYTSAYEQLRRLCRIAGLPRGVTPHSLRHSYATEPLRLGAPLQNVQDALGHTDPRTTRGYDRNRHHLDSSPNYLLATAISDERGYVRETH